MNIDPRAIAQGEFRVAEMVAGQINQAAMAALGAVRELINAAAYITQGTSAEAHMYAMGRAQKAVETAVCDAHLCAESATKAAKLIQASISLKDIKPHHVQ